MLRSSQRLSLVSVFTASHTSGPQWRLNPLTQSVAYAFKDQLSWVYLRAHNTQPVSIF